MAKDLDEAIDAKRKESPGNLVNNDDEFESEVQDPIK